MYIEYKVKNSKIRVFSTGLIVSFKKSLLNKYIIKCLEKY